MNPLCSVDLAYNNGVIVATLQGEVDVSNAADLEEQLLDASNDVRALVVNLEAVRYIDSSGFGMLERLSRRLKLGIVISPGAVVHRAFCVTGFAQLMPVFDDVEEAAARA